MPTANKFTAPRSPTTEELSVGYSVVIPAYNSSLSIGALYERLVPVLQQLELPFEIIIVNDGSPDDTMSVIEKLAARDEKVRAIDLMRNYGQHNALLCGIRQAKYDTLITMDDDLQHPPEEIPKLLEKLREGYDVVYGTPERERHGLFRDLASRVVKLALSRALGATVARRVSAFRVFRTHLRRSFANYSNSLVSIDVLLSWGTAAFGHVGVEHNERAAGRSTYTFGKLVSHAANMMTGFTTVPLQLASVVGFSFTVFGGLVLAFVITRYMLEGTAVAGFTFLASIIAIFSGVQLFSLGIIGEYLARMHIRMMDRPTYTIGRVVSNSHGDGPKG